MLNDGTIDTPIFQDPTNWLVVDPHFIKIADGVNVGPVMAQINAHPELWDQHTARKTYPGTPHSQMSDIWVRFNDYKNLDPNNPAKFSNKHIPVWYPAWNVLTALHPIVRGLVNLVEGDMIGGVLITKIPPGEWIGRHKDSSWHVDYFSKYYLSLQSAPGAIFGCEDDGRIEELEPKTGECWLFDNRKLHWVENKSPIDRVTCIICIRSEKEGMSQV